MKSPLSKSSIYLLRNSLLALTVILSLQGCGGSDPTDESSSLAPTPDAMKKEWTDQGTEAELATGKANTP